MTGIIPETRGALHDDWDLGNYWGITPAYAGGTLPQPKKWGVSRMYKFIGNDEANIFTG